VYYQKLLSVWQRKPVRAESSISGRRSKQSATNRRPRFSVTERVSIKLPGTVDINNTAQVSQLFIRAIDSHLVPSTIYEGSFGFQYSVTSSFVLEANYVFNQARHLWDLSNENQPNLINPGSPPVIPFPNFVQGTSPTHIEWLSSASNSNYKRSSTLGRQEIVSRRHFPRCLYLEQSAVSGE